MDMSIETVRRGLAVGVAAGTMIALSAGAAGAAPSNPNANCVGDEATQYHDVAYFAHQSPQFGGQGNAVSEGATNNCTLP